MPNEPPDSRPRVASWVYKDARNLFEITLPTIWNEDPVRNAVVNASFARERSRAEITISVGLVDLTSDQYSRSVRFDELRRLTRMEKERQVSTEPFGRYENVVRGIWALDAGRDWGPKGSERWPVPSRRGLISIATGPRENPTEWVIQYRTQPEYIAEVTEIISSFRILNEQPPNTTDLGAKQSFGKSQARPQHRMQNPLQNSLACTKCGRIFPRGQFTAPDPPCPVCGYPIKPWMESPLWTFAVGGAVGLPIVGRILVAIISALGMTSPAVRHGAFFFIPTILVLINVPSYLFGQSSGNLLHKRTSEQGLLLVFGFLLTFFALVLTHNYESVAGIR